MSSPLDLAQEALAKEFGNADSAPQVERVVVRKDDSLMLFSSGPAGMRWFQFMDGTITERFPRDETDLPLLAEMTDDELARMEVLAWRPGRRVALLDGGEGVPTILKGFRRKRGLQASANLERIRTAQHACQCLRFPVSLESYPDRNALRMSFMPGVALSIHSRHERLFASIGVDLASLQGLASTDGLESHGPHAELENLGTIVERTQRVTSVPGEGWQELLNSLREAVADLPAGPAVVAHRDLHDGQFLIHEGHAALMDFDMIAAADPVLDVANLSAHMQLRVLQAVDGATQQHADACQQALQSTFEPGQGPEAQRRMRFYRSATFLRLAFVYAVRPRWRHLFPDLIRHSQLCFDELCQA